MGRSHAAGGRTAEAIVALQAALTLDPRFADGWREFAAQRFLAGDVPGGDSAYAEYSRLIPRRRTHDATVALANRRLDAAEGLLRRRLQQSPDDVVALHMLATRGQAWRYLEPERLLNQVLELAPGYAEARFDLANELTAQQRPKEVLPLVERLLAT